MNLLVPKVFLGMACAWLGWTGGLLPQDPMQSDSSLTQARFSLLLAGVDHDPNSANRDRRTDYHTDSLVLLTSRADSKEVDAIHIPRDTLVSISGYGDEKVNGVRMFHGDRPLRSAVKRLTGMTVDAVLYADFPRFKSALRQLGRIPFQLDRSISSPEGEVQLAPGFHRLSAEQALAVARFRHEPLGDIGRVKRQAKLLHAGIISMSRLPYPVYARVIGSLDPTASQQVQQVSYRILHTMTIYHAYLLPGRFGTGAEFGAWVADRRGIRALAAMIDSRDASVRTSADWQQQLDGRDVGGVKIL